MYICTCLRPTKLNVFFFWICFHSILFIKYTKKIINLILPNLFSDYFILLQFIIIYAIFLDEIGFEFQVLVEYQIQNVCTKIKKID